MKAKFSSLGLIDLCGWAMLSALWGVIVFTPRLSLAAPVTPAQAQARAVLKTYYTWINAPLTGDDLPYQRIRERIERALADGQKPSDLLNEYQVSLAKKPNDYKAQFGYYYAAYKAASAPGVDGTDISLMMIVGNLFISLIRAQHPHTYNYARLAFLCSQQGMTDPNLKAIGLRLLQHDTSVYDVKYYLTSTLAASRAPADHALALAYAQDLIRLYPKKPSPRALLGGLHYQVWRRSKDPNEAALAISGYQEYLQLAPQNYHFRRQAEECIAELQRG